LPGTAKWQQTGTEQLAQNWQHLLFPILAIDQMGSYRLK